MPRRPVLGERHVDAALATDGDPADSYLWIACDTVTTRALAQHIRRELGIPRATVNVTDYWRP
ncbi:SIP domain-containing protein [Kitasatospora sp. NPDC094019]|uniref:SIP domain-containing protein n=1 Tax=Kitasatospora sp. NPDC094019 TaxID=3364091 RepID=UPI0037FCF2F5